MFDTAVPKSTILVTRKMVELYSVELARLIDGNIYISVTATTAEGRNAQLLSKEVACETVATIECALAVMQASLGISLPASPTKDFRERLGDNYFRLNIPERPDSARVEELLKEFELIQKRTVQETDNSWRITPLKK
jgi:hypothetical protein